VNVAILVPRRAGVADRDRLWEFARAWWENDHPDWPIVEGHHDVGPFNRSAAINTAARQAGDWDVAVIIDADVLCDPHAVRAAVDVAASTHAMVLAGDERVMLSRQGTEKILGGYTGNWRVRGIQERVYTDSCSCCVVVSRQLWDQVGGFDPLFVGWGFEDIAFRIACETISGKPLIKLSSAMFHLWHTTSHENNQRSPLYQANAARCERYRAAHWDREAVRALLAEAVTTAAAPIVELAPTRIPRIMHRTVPENTSDQIEHWWVHLQQLHPQWEFRTYREPIDPAEWPLTGDLWGLCRNGAQKAGLIRLEALVTHGGVYVDSDVEPCRSFEPLMHLPAFAAWEDETTIPDAVLGAEPNHPAFTLALEKARAVIQGGGDAWQSGPGVTTEVLSDRTDVLVLPPGAFYPHHYLQKHASTANDGPWVFCRHHWYGSWLSPAQRRSVERRQRRSAPS
jgi:hypothetical protein